MALYKKQADKQSGEGLALTEWNDLSSAVAGHAGLTLAISPNDKIGIGTSNPTAKLEIVGDIKANGNVSLEPGNTVSVNYGPWATINRKFIAFQTNYQGDANRGQVHLYAPTNYYANVPAITLAGNYGAGGSVGIGTTTPAEKLDVAGKVKATHFIGDGSGLTNLSVGATGLNLATSSGSKVGIGTTTPQEKLQIGNFQAADQYISVTAAGGNRYKTGLKLSVWKKDYGFVMEHDEKKVGLNFRFHNPDVPSGSSDNILFLSNFGNVGVGTDKPTEKLHVAGNIKANRFIGISLQWGPVLTTDWINNWDAVMNYTVPGDHVMVGLYSEHNNSREDRRFKIKYRKLTLAGG